MKIGILGSGNVARTLGAAWAAKGHEVFIGARNAKSESLLAWQKLAPAVELGTLQQAATFGEVILLAINPWTEIEGVLKSLTQLLKGKAVIDVSNNIEFGQTPRLAFTKHSMGETIQAWLPDSHIVKTLNITPAPMMVSPATSGIVPAVGWVAGNDIGAKRMTSSLLNDLGWDEVVDLGGIGKSRLQENIGLTLSIIVSGFMG